MPYRPQDIYRGRRKFRTPLLILLFLIAFLVCAAIVAFYGLQQFIVYDQDGVRLEFRADTTVETETETAPAVATPDVSGMQVSIVYREPSFDNIALTVGEDCGELHARYIPFKKAQNAASLEAAAAEALSAGCDTVVIEMKDESGQLAWMSVTEQAAAYGTGGILDYTELVPALKEKGLTVIAGISVCADSMMAIRNWPIALLSADGMPYKDENGRYWLDPYSRGVREYTIALVQELAGLGFDEIWLDNLRHPDTASENLRYSVTLRNAPNPHSAVCQLARKIAESMQSSDVKLGVTVGASTLAGGEDNQNGQDLAIFWQLFDRICVYTTNADFDADRSAALSVGGSDVRFVPAFSWSPSEAASGYMVYIPEEE